MAEQYKDRGHYLFNFVHSLVRYLNSGEKEGWLDLETAMADLGLSVEYCQEYLELIKAGDEKSWQALFAEALKAGASIDGLKRLSSCPFKDLAIVFTDGKNVRGDIQEFFIRSVQSPRVSLYLPDPDDVSKALYFFK